MLDLEKLLKNIGANAAQQLPAPEMQPTAVVQNRPIVAEQPIAAEQPLAVPQQGRLGTVPVVTAPQDTPMGVNDQLMPDGLATQAPPPVAPTLTPLQQQEQKYQQDLIAAPKHVNPWMNALYYTLQGIGKTLQPDNQPFVGLGEARKNKQLERDRQALLPLREQAKIQGQEQMQQADIAKSYAAARKQMADIEHLRNQDALAGNKWTTETVNGLKFKHYPDGRYEPLIGADGKQMAQIVDTPVQTVLPDGSIVTETTGQQATNKSRRLEADAQRQQNTNQFNARTALDIAKENAQRKFEADKTNTSNELNWYKTNLDKATQVITANAGLFADAGVAAGLADEARTLADKASELETRLEASTDDAEKKTLQRELDAIPRQMGVLQAKMGATIGKVDRTGALVRQLQTQQIPKPKKVAWEPIKADPISAVRTSGKIAPSSQVDAFAKSKGWSRQQAEAYLRNNGYTIQ